MENESLSSSYPEIAKEWHPTKNGGLSPENVKPKSSKVVWWLCPEGHAYEQSIYGRTSGGYGCSYCSGKRVLAGFNDLATVNPALADEWNYDKNELLPTQVTLHSNKRVWWKCSICGNEWETKINGRANGRGCPICAKKRRIKSFRESRYLQGGINDLATLRPDLVAEWDKEKNEDRFPDDFTTHSKEMIWWKCSVCGNEWKATIKNRADNNSGCPQCKKYTHTSFPEQALFFYVRQVFPNAENRYTEVFKPRKMELDIYIPEIQTGIEYDGKAWHKGNGEKEKEKYEICKSKGIRFIRVAEELTSAKADCDVFILREELSNNSLDAAIVDVLNQISDVAVDVDTERDRSKVILQYVNYIRKNSIAERFPWAAEQWDTELNGGLTPWMINAYSNHHYWWRCEKGHAYKMDPANKTSRYFGCPYCSGHRLLEGFNDLQTRYPTIAEEWDDDKNAPIKAKDVMPGSIKKYWWRCKNGHSYSASPNGRTSLDNGCPICAGKVVLQGFNDLETTYPDAAAKWDYEKNGDLTPQQVLAGSKVSVWWKCPEGHSWENTIYKQARYNSCPICSGRRLQKGENDLSVTHPKLAEEWDWDKNEGKSPSDFTKTSPKKVWWKCQKCQGVWQASIRVRIKSDSGCPYCSSDKKRETRAKNVKKEKRDIVSLFPEIAAEWDYVRNDPLNPTVLTPGSNHKVWWICPKGHHYQAWMSDRTGKRKTGCPYCARKRKLPIVEETLDK